MGKKDEEPINEKANENAVATVNYAVMRHDEQSLQEVIQKNLGNRQLSAFDLDRVKVPLGGMTTWSIPSIVGTEETKALLGVIVSWKDPRAYWATGFASSGGGTPPDCASDDGTVGVGNPGGPCHLCPMAQFGTATGDDGSAGEGQACKQVRQLAIVRQDDLIPLLLNVPPSSLASLNRYFLRLSSKGVPYYGVITRFTLEAKQNKRGIKFSSVVAEAETQLVGPDFKRMKGYAETIGASLEKQPVDAAAF